MTADVVILPVITTLDVPAERVLEQAAQKGLAHVVVLGYDNDGEEFFASSYADGSDVLWLLERLKAQLLAIPEKLRERGN
jgi:hypothetical protein